MSTIRVDEIKGQTPGLVTIDDNLEVSGGISYDYSSKVKTISSNYLMGRWSSGVMRLIQQILMTARVLEGITP